jgi:nicotinate dehydrogenase subunit A
MSVKQIETRINGQVIRWEADLGGNVLGALRHRLGLTASRLGCGQEQCGACHVLLNGQSKPSCQMPIEALDGANLLTLESHAVDGLQSTPFLRALQSAFIAEQAAQCGYCTSGLLISATALLMNAHENVSDLQIREALETHLCRCGAHQRVFRAVKNAAMQCGLKVTQTEVSA